MPGGAADSTPRMNSSLRTWPTARLERWASQLRFPVLNHDGTSSSTVGFTVGSIMCSGMNPMLGQIIFCDDFSGTVLDSSKWETGGVTVYQSSGIVNISEDVLNTSNLISVMCENIEMEVRPLGVCE